MQEPMNRRRFLELSAALTPLTEGGGALEHFSPHLSELAFATPLAHDWYDSQLAPPFNENECYNTLTYNTPLNEMVLFSDHAFEPT